jgi:hypothetical protein
MSVVATDHELIVLPSVLYLPRSGRMNVARAFSEAVSKFDLMPEARGISQSGRWTLSPLQREECQPLKQGQSGHFPALGGKNVELVI